jgi:hypothetical protein
MSGDARIEFGDQQTLDDGNGIAMTQPGSRMMPAMAASGRDLNVPKRTRMKSDIPTSGKARCNPTLSPSRKLVGAVGVPCTPAARSFFTGGIAPHCAAGL